MTTVVKPQAGEWVRQQLDAQKIGVKAAADRSGISRQTWYDLMSGEHPPSRDTQRGVALVLGVEVDWYDRLLAGKEPTISRPAGEDRWVSRAQHVELARQVRELTKRVQELGVAIERSGREGRRGAP